MKVKIPKKKRNQIISWSDKFIRWTTAINNSLLIVKNNESFFLLKDRISLLIVKTFFSSFKKNSITDLKKDE